MAEQSFQHTMRIERMSRLHSSPENRRKGEPIIGESRDCTIFTRDRPHAQITRIISGKSQKTAVGKPHNFRIAKFTWLLVFIAMLIPVAIGEPRYECELFEEDDTITLPNLQQYIGDLCSSSRGPAVIPPKGGWRGVSVGYATATEGPPDIPGAIFMDEGLLEFRYLNLHPSALWNVTKEQCNEHFSRLASACAKRVDPANPQNTMQRFASSAFNVSGEEDGSFRDGDRVLMIYVLSSDATRQTVKEEISCEEEEERKRSKLVKRGFPFRAKHGIRYSRGW